VLKKFAFVAMLWSVSQASPSLPTQGKKQADSSGDSQKPAPGNNVSAFPGKIQTYQRRGKDKQDSVAVSELPSVSVDRDWIDYSLLACNVSLAVIGFFGVRAAIRTLRAIKEQAREMKEQADLMERQTKVMEAQFDQWVQLINWRIEKTYPQELRLTVDLLNPTGFPITLDA
jgi:hypothetical protein